jgi:predicted transposase/invertase (TIGR01784 family)
MDLKIDYAFKKVFGKPGNEPILIAFLNAALSPADDERITSIEIMNSTRNREHVGDKMSVMDILAKTGRGVLVNIEIQLANEHDMERRTLYYWAGVYVDQVKKGMAFQELKQTITINIVNFRYIKQTDRYHTKFRVKEDMDGFELTDVLEVHFMELPKLMDWWEVGNASPEENLLARWLLLLEADNHEDIRGRLEAIAMEDRAMKKAFEEWEEVSMDDATWNEYRERRKAVLDDLAKVRERELREQKAHERGFTEGIEQGIEKGIVEGKRATARELIAEGADMKLIAKVTGLAMDELEELAKEIN